MIVARVVGVLVVLSSVGLAEDVFRESFDGPAREGPLVRTWGDEPTAVAANAVVPGAGTDGTAAACLRLEFPDEVQHNLSYWTYHLPQRVPLVPKLESISFRVKTNLPVSIKIAIWPYTTKNKRNDSQRLELRKYCPRCRTHRLHREIK